MHPPDGEKRSGADAGKLGGAASELGRSTPIRKIIYEEKTGHP